MIFPLEADQNAFNKPEDFDLPPEKNVIQYESEDFQNRYADLLNKNSEEKTELQELSYEQAHQFMDLVENYNASPSRYQIINKAQRDWWGFLRDLESNKYPQNVVGQVIYDIVNNFADLHVIASGQRVSSQVCRDLLARIDYFKNTPQAQDIFVQIIKENTNMIAFKHPQTSKGLPLKKESLKKLAFYLNNSYWKLYFNIPNDLTKKEKEEVFEYRKKVLEGTEDLLTQSTSPEFNLLKKDPAFPFYKKIHQIGINFYLIFPTPTDIKTPREQRQWEFLIARNLFHQGFSLSQIDQNAITNELKRILKMRARYHNVSLFTAKDIFVFAGNETININGDPHNFGKDILIQSLKQKGGNVNRIRASHNSAQKAKETKNKILENLKTRTPQARTFMFDMHGKKNKLFLYSGVYITPKELFQAYLQRWKGRGNPPERDIFIFDACHSHGFIMEKFYPLIKEYNKKNKTPLPLPILIFSMEYNQFGIRSYNSKYGNSFQEETLQLRHTGNTKIKDVIKNDVQQEDSNPSVYVPDEKNRPVQISFQNTENQETEEEYT